MVIPMAAPAGFGGFGESIQWKLFGAVVPGFAFCWWARLYLGRLWSSSVTRKAEHNVVDTGPFALVRHPLRPRSGSLHHGNVADCWFLCQTCAGLCVVGIALS
jgi:hypothetical protein